MRQNGRFVSDILVLDLAVNTKEFENNIVSMLIYDRYEYLLSYNTCEKNILSTHSK